MLSHWAGSSPVAAAVQSLFAAGEAGAMFIAQKPAEWGGAADLVTMFTDNLGTTPVTALEQTVGMHLDTRPIFKGPELKSGGVVGVVGAPAAATYNTSTFVGTANRVDASNQSWVEFPITNGLACTLSITCNGASTQQLNVLRTNTGNIGGTFITSVVPSASGTINIPASISGNSLLISVGGSGSIDFTINTLRQVVASPNTAGQPLRGSDQVTNGALTTSTGWSDASSAGGAVAFGAGGATITNTSGVARLRQTLAVVPNSWNEFRFDLSGVTTGTPTLSIGSTAGGTDYFVSTALVAGTTKRLMFFATASSAFVNFSANTAGAMVVANVSSKIVYGNHRSQSSAPARARLSARYNKVTARNANPVDLTNVTKSGDASSTLTLVSDTAALAAAGLSGVCTLGNVYKLDNSAGAALAAATIAGNTGSTNTQACSVWWRGSGLADLGTTSNTSPNQTLTAAYAKFNFTATSSTTTRSAFVIAQPGAVVFFILPDMRESCYSYLPTPQTIIGTGATAADYDDTGFPARLVYSGAQGYATGVVDFSGSTAVQAFVGATKLSDAAQTSLLGVSNISAAGGFEMFAPTSPGSNDFSFYSNGGTAFNGAGQASAASPAARVVSGQADTAGVGSWVARLNGVATTVVGTSTTGTGTMAAASFMSFGGRSVPASGPGALPLTGDEFISIVRGGATPDANTISYVERYCARFPALSF